MIFFGKIVDNWNSFYFISHLKKWNNCPGGFIDFPPGYAVHPENLKTLSEFYPGITFLLSEYGFFN